MNKLHGTCLDSTLGNHRKIAVIVFGKHSPAVAWLDEMIKKQGEDQEVIADEAQVIEFLRAVHDGNKSETLTLTAATA